MNRIFSLLFGVVLIIVGINQPCYAGTLTFSDDFNDGNLDGWTFASRDGRSGDPALNWIVEDGKLLEDSIWDAQFALVENLSLSSQSIEVQADILGWAGIALWYKDINNFVTIGSYPSGAAIYVGEMINGIGYTSTYSYSGGQSILFDFRVDANSSTGELDFYVGGEYVFTHTVQTRIRTGLSGLVGGNGGGYFDNFIVTGKKKLKK